jgi:hypothetical protein
MIIWIDAHLSLVITTWITIIFGMIQILWLEVQVQILMVDY